MNRQFSSPATRPLPPPPPPQAEGRASPVRRMSGASIPGVPLNFGNNPPPPGFNVNMNNINVNVNFPPTVGHAAGFRLQDLGAISRDFHRKTSLDLPLTARQISSSSSRSPSISSVASLNSPNAERTRQEFVRQFQNLSVTRNLSLSSSQHTIRAALGSTDIPSETPEAYLIRLQEIRYHKTLRKLADWEALVSHLKSENRRKEMEKWLRLNPRDPHLTYSKVEELTNGQDAIRKLKVEILSLVAEVDEYGDVPLGDVNRSSKKNAPLSPQKASQRDDEPPPIPPRIPKLVPGQSILDIHVPAPNLPPAYRGSVIPPLPPPKSLAIPNGSLLNRSHSNSSQNTMASSPGSRYF